VITSLVPNKVPGWHAAVSTTRNAAYDVPVNWEFHSPGEIKGYRDPDGTLTVMSGVAEHQAAPCPGESRPHADAWAGVTGAPTADTDLAARALAKIWAAYFRVDDKMPQVTVNPPAQTVVGGSKASYAIATVTKPAGACGVKTALVHTVALPGKNGQSVVWVLLADTDSVPMGDVQTMLGSIRPAGLEAKCDPARQAVGSWC
jgi:hypothetical protein